MPTSDADGDLESVRWYADGVLLAPGLTSMPFTGPHVLRAVARDDRGARKTATKSISCVQL
jgi:hypothetical protein